MTGVVLYEVLQAALAQAQAQPGAFPDDKRRRHAERSRFWVGALHDALRQRYPGAELRVLSKHRPENKSEFALNELLYDLTVCEVDTVLSSHHRKELRYVKRVFWQVESEFANNSQEALRDFNKLVLGSAENKLFIGPRSGDDEAFIEVLRRPAEACTGQVFVALVPHPSMWDIPTPDALRVWRFESEAWQQVSAEMAL